MSRLIIEGDRKIPMKKNLMRVKGNQVYKVKEVKNFETWLAWKAAAAMKEQGWRKTDQPVRLSLEVVFGDKRKRDLQNCFASVCDSLNNIVYVDDCQIKVLAASKEYIKDEWSFILKIEVIDETT
jgi:Holliday junction resolvase RusA-like endonuclease